MNQPSLFDQPQPTPFERGMEGSAKAARKWTDQQIALVAHDVLERLVRLGV